MERQAKNQGWGGRPDRRTRPGSTRGERPGENSPHLLGSIGERESKKNSLRAGSQCFSDGSSSCMVLKKMQKARDKFRTVTHNEEFGQVDPESQAGII